eukprot:TRINITY_DN2577_c0_g1_i1.p1 TRINITY_DN2577_c0_g1~~TRINITY_DN2577_c0_g1_i1.p1  ORF type:complete len:247 (+),score=52.58 TRINITY_DN2577_c0_g1_i1:41-742(+)
MEQEKIEEISETNQDGEPIRGRDLGSDYVPFISAVKQSPWFTHIVSIVQWNDPVQTGLLFAIGNLFFFLITFGEYSLLTILGYLALVLLIVCGVYANGVMLAAHFKKQPTENPFAAKLKNPYVASRLSLEPHSESIINFINDILGLIRAALFWTDFKFSVQVGFSVWVIALLGKYFAAVTLLYATFLTAFVWPRLYVEKKAQIDQAYGFVSSKIALYVDLIVSKIPLGKKKSQ